MVSPPRSQEKRSLTLPHFPLLYCFDAVTATGAPVAADRRTIAYGRPPAAAVAHGKSVNLF